MYAKESFRTEAEVDRALANLNQKQRKLRLRKQSKMWEVGAAFGSKYGLDTHMVHNYSHI